MGDAEKKAQTKALRNFTRNLNSLNELLNDAAVNSLVSPLYEKVKICWEKLEYAHDAYIDAVDAAVVDVENDPEGYPYIDDANTKYNKMLKQYSAYLKSYEAVQRAEAELGGTDPSQDMSTIKSKFTDVMEKTFSDAKKWFM